MDLDTLGNVEENDKAADATAMACQLHLPRVSLQSF
jgi:hypothetical protein